MQLKLVYACAIALCCCQCSRLPSDHAEVNTAFVIPEQPAHTAAPIAPVASEMDLPAAVVSLGHDLYHDTRLSGNERISCATCHPLDSTGTVVNANLSTNNRAYYDIPTIFNTGEHFAYFWNGRAQSLESVVRISIEAENIMDASWNLVERRLLTDATYVEKANLAYPSVGLTEETAVDALATYVRSLTTPNAAFDRWLDGESLSESAQAGYTLFSTIGCIRCHQGASVGGNMFASFRGYLENKQDARNTDLGRFNVTNNEAHRYQFKVPGLRNVAVTAPYFHDGSAASLKDAVEAMAQYQLGLTLDRSEINQIVSFLESLTGWRDGALLGGSQ